MGRPMRSAGGLLALCLGLAIPLTPAKAEPTLPYERGRKVVTEHKVKSLVGPSMQVDEQGQVSLAWMEEDKDVRSVLYARSTEPGGSMGSPVRINRPASMGVDRQGRLYVVWYTEGTDEIPAVYIAYSDDRGNSFSDKRQLNVAKNTFPDHPQIAVDPEGRILVVWEEQAPVKRDVVMSVSTDRGATFTAPHKVNEKKSQTPVVAVNSQGLFALAWMEHGMPGHKIVMQTLHMPSVKVAAEPAR